jgi:midasin (ATPase involved in ribosome maturation)
MADTLERGDWILLPNADQCPAAILDRQNPLLERPAVKLCSDSDRLALRNNCGSLLVAEAPPNADGSAVVVRPPPHSRVFMTVVRAHGSKVCDGLSKAVRNRAL